MSFDRAMIYAFYALLMTAVSGSLYMAGWMLVKRRFDRGHERLLLKYLRIGGLIYLCPILFVVILWRWGDQVLVSPWLGKHRTPMSIFITVPEIVWAARIGFLLWGIGAAVMLAFWLEEKHRLRQICRSSSAEENQKVLDCCGRMQECLGIHRKIIVLRSEGVASPCMTGSVRVRIILPYRQNDYTDAELEALFAHELTHCKRRDMFFRNMFLLVSVIHALNPLAHWMRRYNKEYSEMACDLAVCERLSGLFSIKEYGERVLSIAIKDGEEWKSAVAVAEKEPSLKRRMEALHSRKYCKRANKRTVALITALLILGSSMTAYAAGNEMVKFQMDSACSLMDITEEENIWVNTLEEQYISPEEFAAYEAGGVITDDSEPFLNRSGESFSVSITVGGIYESGWFHLDKGQTVTVSVCTDPDGQLVQAGIKYQNGSATAVTGVEPDHRFTAQEEGSYCFFVRNLSSQPIKAYGFYH